MPFTFSHPAAILPFTFLPARWISVTGLVIGSTAPDFEYFFRMKIYSVYSHTLAGMFWFDLPLTILHAFIFHLLVRDSLISNLPHFLAKRLAVFKNFSWVKYFKGNFLVVIFSMLVGIASHLLWDSFTHDDGFFVQRIEGLKNSCIISGFTIPVYKIVQHVSTLIGGLLILIAVLRFPADGNYKNVRSVFPYWIVFAVITSLVLAIRVLTGLHLSGYGNVFITLISGGLLGLIITPKILVLKK